MSDWIDAAYHWLADMSIKGVTLRELFSASYEDLDIKTSAAPETKNRFDQQHG